MVGQLCAGVAAGMARMADTRPAPAARTLRHAAAAARDCRRRLPAVPHAGRTGGGSHLPADADGAQAARDARAARHLRRHLPVVLYSADAVSVQPGYAGGGDRRDRGHRAVLRAGRREPRRSRPAGRTQAEAGRDHAPQVAAADGRAVRSVSAYLRSAVGHAGRFQPGQYGTVEFDVAGQHQPTARVRRRCVPRPLRCARADQ